MDAYLLFITLLRPRKRRRWYFPYVRTRTLNCCLTFISRRRIRMRHGIIRFYVYRRKIGMMYSKLAKRYRILLVMVPRTHAFALILKVRIGALFGKLIRRYRFRSIPLKNRPFRISRLLINIPVILYPLKARLTFGSLISRLLLR